MAPQNCADQRRAAPTLRTLIQAMTLALGPGAALLLATDPTLANPAPEPSPVASPAPVAYEFSSELLASGGSSKVDVSRFALGNAQIAGTYRADIFLNGRWLIRRDVRLAGTPAVTCIDAELLRLLGVNPAALSPDGLALINGGRPASPGVASAACLPIETLAGDSSASFDSGELRLEITIAQASLARQAKGYVPPSAWDRGVTAGLLAYNLNAYRTTGKFASESIYAGLNAGVNIDRWRIRHSGNYSHQSRQGSRYTALGSYAMTDLPDWQAAVALGDVNTSGQLFPTARVRGVSLTTDERMLPESRRGYAPVIRGVANTNARVEIKQNNNLIYSTTVPPGPFEINDLYPTGYGGDLIVTITEADGSQRSTAMPFSALPQLLRAGSLYYSAQAGQLRGYQRDVHLLQGTAQYGLSNDLTVAGGLQVAERYAALLAGGAWNTPLGALQANVTAASLARSGQERTNGWSLDASWAKSIPATHTNVSFAAYRYSSGGFYDLDEAMRIQDLDAGRYGGSVPGWRLRQRAVLSLYQSMPAGMTLNLSANTETYWNRSARQSGMQIGFYKQFGAAQLSLHAQSNRNLLTGDTQRTYTFGLTLPLGGPNLSRNSIAAFGTHDSAVGEGQRIGFFGNYGDRGELSYSINAQNDARGRSLSASSAYTAKYALLTASASSGQGTQQQSFGASGGIVLADRHVVFAPYLGETIGLLRVEGAQGIRVAASQASELDSNGYTLLPYLSPYAANYVELNLDNAPLSARFDANSTTIAPHAGAVVLLNFKRLPGYTLMLRARRADGTTLPFGATVYDSTGALVGSVAQAGRIEAATNSLTGSLRVAWGDGSRDSCTIRYNLPAPPTGADEVIQAQVVCQGDDLRAEQSAEAQGNTAAAPRAPAVHAPMSPAMRRSWLLSINDAAGQPLPKGAQVTLTYDESRVGVVAEGGRTVMRLMPVEAESAAMQARWQGANGEWHSCRLQGSDTDAGLTPHCTAVFTPVGDLRASLAAVTP